MPERHSRFLQGVLVISLAFSALPTLADEILIRNGYIMPMTADGKDYPQGDLLIKEDKIVAIGKDLPAKGARVIDASHHYVLPGFVDAHNHLWITNQRGLYRNAAGKFFPVSSQLAAAMHPQDIYSAMYNGALELINSGVTTTGDFFDNIHGPAWGDAGLKALQDAHIRAILYYGGPDKTTRSPIDIEHLSLLASQPHPRVQLGLAWRLPRDLDSADNWAMRQQEFSAAQQHHWPIQVHVSGEANAMFNALIARKYLNPQVTVVHATDASTQQLQALQQAGASLVTTPISEARVGYGLTRLDHFQQISRQGIGIDGNSLSGSGDIFAVLRFAALTLSGSARDETAPDARHLLELATRRGAEALGLGNITGSLETGKRADIQIISAQSPEMSGFAGGDPSALLLYSTQPQDIQTVIIDGQIVKLNGVLQGVNYAEVLSKAQKSATEVLHRAQQNTSSQ